MLNFLFSYSLEKEHPWLSRICLAVTYLSGGWLWGKFFNWGKIPFGFHDWAEINAARLAYLRDAAIQGILPLHASETAHLRNLTDRIMSIPDFILSPQYLLLRWMNIGEYILINTLLLYTLAFIAFLWIRRRYSLSLVIFSIMVLLFNFNGHLIGHFSIGHITWWGYFLFPIFFIQVFRLMDGTHSWAWVAQTSILLFMIFLQGAYHHFVWCLIFLGVLALVAWRHALTILKTLVFANLISMVRLLPPALLLGKFDTDFYGGYRFPWHILEAMVIERLPEKSQPFQNFGSNLGYWEFDLYVGWIGALFIISGIFLLSKRSTNTRTFLPLLIPMTVIAVLSLRNIYQPFSHLPIPLLNGERVTARMFILPFSMAILLSAITIQLWINQKPRGLIFQAGMLTALAILGYELVRHTLQWQVITTSLFFPETPVNLAIKTLSNHPDPPYTLMLGIGAAISLISLGILYFLIRREKIIS